MANDKLIYVGPLESQFENLVKSWCGTFSGPAYMDALERLRKAPGVDAVEVVRCGKCEKCLVDNTNRELNLCMKRPSFPVRVKLDGFCSEGKRRQEHV